jgi:hypothetical protein
VVYFRGQLGSALLELLWQRDAIIADWQQKRARCHCAIQPFSGMDTLENVVQLDERFHLILSVCRVILVKDYIVKGRCRYCAARHTQERDTDGF